MGGGINTYAYVGGNPVSYTDPLGNLPLAPILVGAAAADGALFAVNAYLTVRANMAAGDQYHQLRALEEKWRDEEKQGTRSQSDVQSIRRATDLAYEQFIKATKATARKGFEGEQQMVPGKLFDRAWRKVRKFCGF